MTASRNQAGLTLVEVLVAMMLLAIVLVPAIQALQTGIVGTDVHADIADNQLRLTSRIEELLAEPYSNLADAAAAAGSPSMPTSYSDAAGPPGRLIVYLSEADGDNADADNDLFTGTDAGLMWLRVEVEGSVLSLQTLRAQTPQP